MRHPHGLPLAALAALAGLALASGPARWGEAQGPPAAPAAATPAAATPRTLAEVDGEPITEEDLQRHLGLALQRLEQQVHDMRRDGLDRLIGDRLLAREAARRGVSVQALTEAEITSKVGPVSSADADAFYDANRTRLSGSKDQLRERIREHLRATRLDAERERVVSSLRARASVRVRVEAPPIFRVAVALEGAHARGPATAPVTVVEFSDFHCPFCKQAQPLLAELRTRYGDRLRLVYKHLPLDRLHPTARRAAEAAECAGDQGKFWLYHDKLFASDPDGAPETLKTFAQDLGLDAVAFGRCLDERTHRGRVQKDVEEAERLGVSYTPAFFVNGRLVHGPNPREVFARLIEEELAGRAAAPVAQPTRP
jgi:protein-disulfide isomerase